MARAAGQPAAQRNDRHAGNGGQNPAYRPAPIPFAAIGAAATVVTAIAAAFVATRSRQSPRSRGLMPSGCRYAPHIGELESNSSEITSSVGPKSRKPAAAAGRAHEQILVSPCRNWKIGQMRFDGHGFMQYSPTSWGIVGNCGAAWEVSAPPFGPRTTR